MGSTMTPTVVYVAGSSRSGTTLVERAIGAIPGFATVGEALDLFRQALRHDERCGCGEPLSTCPFWAKVAAEAPVLSDPVRIRRMERLQRAMVRQRRVPALAVPRFRDDLAEAALIEYGEGYAEIYGAVAQVSGASTVVDASKWPVQALALWVAGLDVRVVHVVRDPRGVAYSQSKVVTRPQDREGGQLSQMARRPVLSTAARWTATQAQVELLRRKGIRTGTVRYEDFVADPAGALALALDAVGIGTCAEDLEHLSAGCADLPASHGIAGNPSRFRSGVVTLRVDDEWRTGLSAPQRVAVTALAAPASLGLAARERRGGARSVLPAPAWRPIGADEWPDIAVVVPTRGRPDLVRDTLRAAVAQDYPGRLDIVVVHDQEPEDHDLEAFGEPRRSIRVVSNTHVAGLAGARNTGLEQTDCLLVASCDDDDVWHPTKLTTQVTRLREQPDLGVVGSGIRLMMPDDVVAEWPARSERFALDALLRNRIKELHSSTLVMRREVFDAAGGYDETLPHGYGEDYDWVLRAARVGAVGCVTEPLADINKRVQSWYQGRSSNTLEALRAFLERHPEIRTSRRGYARVLGQMAFVESTMGRRADAARHATKGLLTYPATPHVVLAYGHIVTGVDPAHLLRVARRFGRGLS